MAKIKVVIRNMDDVINFQILRWKRKFPDAEEPEEFSPNEIGPGDHFRPQDEISEADVDVILEDDKRWVGTQAGTVNGRFSGMVRRGTYEKGYGSHNTPEFQALAKASHKEHYDSALAAVLGDLQKEFGDEYDIVYEGEYAKRVLGEG